MARCRERTPTQSPGDDAAGCTSVPFRRLGRAEHGSGFDRAFAVRTADQLAAGRAHRGVIDFESGLPASPRAVELQTVMVLFVDLATRPSRGSQRIVIDSVRSAARRIVVDTTEYACSGGTTSETKYWDAVALTLSEGIETWKRTVIDGDPPE